MVIEFFNVLWITLFKSCLIGFKLDTSRLPFSVYVKLIPFYSIDFWIKTQEEYVVNLDKTFTRTDILIPFLCDMVIIR